MARKPDLARRSEIAARAFEVIRARGVHRTTMSDIAVALEMKRPTLYWYFKDLSGVFEAVIEQMQKRLEAFVLGRLGEIDHPIDVLETLVEANLDFYGDRHDLIIVLFQLWAVAASDDPSRIIERSQRFLLPVRLRLIALVQGGIDDGRVAPCDAAGIVDLVLSIADGAMVQRVTMNADARVVVAGLKKYLLEPLRLDAQRAQEPANGAA